MAGQRIELPPYSMCMSTPVYDMGDVIVFGLLQPAAVPHPSDELWTVPTGSEHRLDLLAADFYGIPDLWWILATVNNITDPLIGPPVGSTIRVPTRSRLLSEGVLNT